MKVWQLIGMVETDGWYLVRTRGSHRPYKQPEKRGTVTIPGKRATNLHSKTAASILEQDGDPLPEPTGPGVCVARDPVTAAA